MILKVESQRVPAAGPPDSREYQSMHLTLSLRNLLPILALVLGIAAIVAPRFLNYIVAIFLIAYALVGFGLLR